MWHEARKQERLIRGLIVDYRKRAERRQDFYEKIQADPTQFIQVHGRRCKIHLDPAVAAAGDGAAIIVPWQGQHDNLIDRFDVRAHLDYIPPASKVADSETTELSQDERQCNYERYRILAQNDFLNVSEEKFLHQLYLEEQFGANAQLDTDREKGHKKKQQKAGGASIGYTYEDKELATGPQPFSHLMAAPAAIPPKPPEKSSDSESDSDIDMDVSIDISKLDTNQAHELNACGRNYGMQSNDFYSFLTKDADEADALRLAREEEQEKMLLSGRKSRRERRAQKERRIACRPLSPPSYAAKEEVKIDEKKEESESRSPSPSDINSGKITYITSFGGEDELQPHSKISINFAKGTNTLGDSCMMASNTAGSSKCAYAQKVKENLEKYQKSNQGSKERNKTSDSPRRHRSRSRSRCRSRSQRRDIRSKRRKEYSRSRSQSQSYEKRRNRSRSLSYERFRNQRRYQVSRSRSRGNSKGRSSYRKRYKYSKSRSSSCHSDSSQSLYERTRRLQKPGHRASKEFQPTISQAAPTKMQTSVGKSLITYPQGVTSMQAQSTSKKKTETSQLITASNVASGSSFDVAANVVEPPPPPLKRYYGRKRENESSSDSNLNSDGEFEAKVPVRATNEDVDDRMDVDTTSERSNPLPSPFTSGKQTGKYISAMAETKSTGSTRLNLRERLKRKMQNLLNKQYKADKQAEIERTERERQQQQEREDEMRELALKLRRRQRELRHKYGTPSSGKESVSQDSEAEIAVKPNRSKSCSSERAKRVDKRRRTRSRSRQGTRRSNQKRSKSRSRSRTRQSTLKRRSRTRSRSRGSMSGRRRRSSSRSRRRHDSPRHKSERWRRSRSRHDRSSNTERTRRDRGRDKELERNRDKSKRKSERKSETSAQRSGLESSSLSATGHSSRNRIVISAPPKLKKLVDY